MGCVGPTSQLIAQTKACTVGRGDLGIQSCGMAMPHFRMYLSVPMYETSLLFWVEDCIRSRHVMVVPSFGSGGVVLPVSGSVLGSVGKESHMIPGGWAPSLGWGWGMCILIALCSLASFVGSVFLGSPSHVVVPLMRPGGWIWVLIP